MKLKEYDVPVPLKEHVQHVLLENQRGAKLFEAISEGWAAFDNLYPQRHLWRRKSTSRHMVWEEVVRRMLAVAADDPNIVVVDHRDTVSLIIEDEVLLRLKHADVTLVSRNFPTVEAQEFDDHDIDLFGLSGLQRVRLCYVLDQFETELIWVGVVATNKGKHLWKLELTNAADLAVEQLPLWAHEEDTAKLARVKKSETDADEKKRKDNG